MPEFCRKNVQSLKNTMFSYHFFSNFAWKTLRCHAHMIKKTSILSTCIILWIKKVNRLSFVSDFSRKNHLSHAHILSRKRPFSKKHFALIPVFCRKNVQSLKNTLLSCQFLFKFYMKNLLLKPIFDHKKSIMSKLHSIMGPKSQ